MLRRPPRSTLFLYTAVFRSRVALQQRVAHRGAPGVVVDAVLRVVADGAALDDGIAAVQVDAVGAAEAHRLVAERPIKLLAVYLLGARASVLEDHARQRR